MKQVKKEHLTLLCVSLAWFLILSGRYSISNLLPQIIEDLDFTLTQAGMALTTMWLFYAATQFPAGIYSDIKGRKISIIMTMILFSVSYLIVGLSSSFIMFFFALIFLGIGTGGYPAVGISMITDVFKEKRGKALGIRDSAGSLAYGVPIIAAIFTSLYGWRMFFILWSSICFISIYIFYIGTEESTTLPTSATVKQRILDGVNIYKIKSIQLLFVVNLFIAITWISYMSFFPSYLILTKGFSEVQAALALGILGIGGFIFKPIIGSLSDRYNKKIIIIILSTITAVGTLGIIYSSNFYMILMISFIPSFATAIFPIISSSLMDSFEEKGRAGKLGFYRSSLILIASPSSAIIGFLADQYTFDVPFFGISAILFLAAAILSINMLFIWKKNSKNKEF